MAWNRKTSAPVEVVVAVMETIQSEVQIREGAVHLAEEWQVGQDRLRGPRSCPETRLETTMNLELALKLLATHAGWQHHQH
jgi:hypothetical protein